MITLMGVDPGGMTGVALCRFPSGTGDIIEDRIFEANELPPMEAIDWVDEVLKHRGKEEVHLLVEAYTVTSNTVRHARQYDALEVIGATKWLCYKEANVTWKLQTPASRKVVSNDVLHNLDMYKGSKDKHMIDAAKHLVLGALKLGLIKAEEMVVDLRK